MSVPNFDAVTGSGAIYHYPERIGHESEQRFQAGMDVVRCGVAGTTINSTWNTFTSSPSQLMLCK